MNVAYSNHCEHITGTSCLVQHLWKVAPFPVNLTGGQYGVLALRLSDGVERQHGRVFATELTLSNSSTTDNTGQFDSNCHLHNEQNPGYKRSLDEDLYYHGGPKVKDDKKKRQKQMNNINWNLTIIGRRTAIELCRMKLWWMSSHWFLWSKQEDSLINGPQFEKIMERLERLKDNRTFRKTWSFGYFIPRFCLPIHYSHGITPKNWAQSGIFFQKKFRQFNGVQRKNPP